MIAERCDAAKGTRVFHLTTSAFRANAQEWIGSKPITHCPQQSEQDARTSVITGRFFGNGPKFEQYCNRYRNWQMVLDLGYQNVCASTQDFNRTKLP